MEKRWLVAGEFLQRTLLLWLIALCAVAFYWVPIWNAVRGGLPSTFDPFLATKQLNLLNPLIQVAMFIIGALLPRDEIQQVFRRWPTVLGGTAVQYISMPLLAYLVGHFSGVDHATMIGIIMVGCVPGAMASNVLTMTARGNVSYSISLTTSATLLSPIAVPLALWLTLGAHIEQDPLKVSLDLLLTVVLPVLLGHGLSRLHRVIATIAERIGPMIANLVILWIIATVVGFQRENLSLATGTILGLLLIVNIAGYLAGWLGGKAMRLDVPMRRALTLEVGMQNCGLGTYLTLQYFPDLPTAAIPPAIYTFGCMLTGTMLAQAWRWSGMRASAGRD